MFQAERTAYANALRQEKSDIFKEVTEIQFGWQKYRDSEGL